MYVITYYIILAMWLMETNKFNRTFYYKSHILIFYNNFNSNSNFKLYTNFLFSSDSIVNFNITQL